MSIDENLQHTDSTPASISAPAFLALILGCLLLSHGALKAYLPHPTVVVSASAIIMALLWFLAVVRGDRFSTALVILVCSHFAFALEQGGYWNLVIFPLVVVLLSQNHTLKRFSRAHPGSATAIAILFAFQFIGMLIHFEGPFFDRLAGTLSLASMAGIMIILSLEPLDMDRLQRLSRVWVSLLGWMTLVALNQHFAWFHINSPLMGTYHFPTVDKWIAAPRPGSTLGHIELFGEHAVLSMVFLLSLLLGHKQLRRGLMPWIATGLLACGVNILLSGTRSAWLLATFTLLLFGLAVLFLNRPFKLPPVRQMIWLLPATILFVSLAQPLGWQRLRTRLAQTSQQSWSWGSLVTGQAINRGDVFPLAMQRLSEQTWCLGHGLSTPPINHQTWFGEEGSRFSDYHNLYFSLPPLFGWVGAAAFLLLWLHTGWRLLRHLGPALSAHPTIAPLLAGFALFWFIFFLDQFKTVMIRQPGYHMVCWIWLGLSHALIVNARRQRIRNGEGS